MILKKSPKRISIFYTDFILMEYKSREKLYNVCSRCSLYNLCVGRFHNMYRASICKKFSILSKPGRHYFHN